MPNRPTQSISSETTLEQDLPLAQLDPLIRSLAERTWKLALQEVRQPRTVVLKLKTSDFRILTRSHTPAAFPASCEELIALALALCDRVALGPRRRYRLVGVGLGNFSEPTATPAQSPLFR